MMVTTLRWIMAQWRGMQHTIKSTLEDVRLHEHITVLGAKVRVALEHLGNILLARSHRGSGNHVCAMFLRM